MRRIERKKLILFSIVRVFLEIFVRLMRVICFRRYYIIIYVKNNEKKINS